MPDRLLYRLPATRAARVATLAWWKKVKAVSVPQRRREIVKLVCDGRRPQFLKQKREQPQAECNRQAQDKPKLPVTAEGCFPTILNSLWKIDVQHCRRKQARSELDYEVPKESIKPRAPVHSYFPEHQDSDWHSTHVGQRWRNNAIDFSGAHFSRYQYSPGRHDIQTPNNHAGQTPNHRDPD